MRSAEATPALRCAAVCVSHPCHTQTLGSAGHRQHGDGDGDGGMHSTHGMDRLDLLGMEGRHGHR